MHQGAVGLRGGVRARIGVGTSGPRPTPLPQSPRPDTQSLSVKSVSHSVSQAGQQGSRAGSACRVARNVQPTCPPALPQCCPVGGVSGCLGCLENFSETPGHPVCFGLCSTHHTPSAHTHHTTPHHSTAITTTVQHALHVPTYPATPAPWPGCQAALALVPMWHGCSCATRPPRLRCLGEVPRPRRAPVVLPVSWSRVEKLLLPSPSFVYQVHNPLNHDFTST